MSVLFEEAVRWTVPDPGAGTPEIIGMDFLGPIKPQCGTGARYVLVMIDYFSRFVWAWVTENAGGEELEFFFKHEIGRAHV